MTTNQLSRVPPPASTGARRDQGTWLHQVMLDRPFRRALREIAAREGVGLGTMAARIEATRPRREAFEAAARAYILAYYRAAATEDGHLAAGHPAMLSFESGAAEDEAARPFDPRREA